VGRVTLWKGRKKEDSRREKENGRREKGGISKWQKNLQSWGKTGLEEESSLNNSETWDKKTHLGVGWGWGKQPKKKPLKQ